MEYVALKVCNFDRPYSPGERIDASVIDASIVQNAIAQGFIGVEIPDEKAELQRQIKEKDRQIQELNEQAQHAKQTLEELRAQAEAASLKKGQKAEE